MTRENIAILLERAIVAASEVLAMRRDAVLRMHCKLGELTLGEKHFEPGALLPGANGRLTQLKRMLDRAPFGPMTETLREVRHNGRLAIGLSWADLDESFVLSLGHGESWSEVSIPCERNAITEPCELERSAIEVRNLASVEHVRHWRQSIEDYGKEFTGSSLLYEGSGFVMRMHFHDHPPPHVHIYPRRGDTKDLIAKISVQNGAIMEGTLSSALNAEISKFIHDHREELLESWGNIQGGRPPLRLQ